jgi:hypothetical protein
MKYIYFSIIFILSGITAAAQTVTRGPYLQNPTSTSMVVKWRTDVASDSRVSFGTSQGSLTTTVDSLTSTNEHTVKISGLDPYTQYYYSIGTTTQVLAGPSANHRFKTSLAPGVEQPIRVWAIGDFGKGNQKEADVRDSYVDYLGSGHNDVWLWLGDNAYDTGTDQEYQDKVFNDQYGYNSLFTYMPFMPCPGNHDYGSISPPPGSIDPQVHTGAYFDIIDVPKNGEAGGVASGTELYYSFDYSNVHFVSLNSELGSTTAAYDYIGAFSGDIENLPMVSWLRQDLTANTKEWTIAYWHQCPYSKGSHDTDDFWEFYIKAMRDNITPILEEYGVDLVVCGHSHVYERSYLIEGHTGTSDNFSNANLVNGGSGNFDAGQPYYKYRQTADPNKGTVYVVCGNAGSSEGGPSLDHPAMAVGNGCDTCIGSFVIDIDANRLDGKYLKADGTIGDHFTMIKSDFPISISEEANSPVMNVNVFPNPFSSSARIEYELMENKTVTIELTDITGRQIQTLFSGNQSTGKHTIDIDGQKLNLSKGEYIVLFSNGENIYHKRVVKFE